jgi:hypothetical protein
MSRFEVMAKEAIPARKRSLQGKGMLAACVACALVYAFVAYKVFTPHYTQDYKRTFVTNEFGIFPSPKPLHPENFLAVTAGEVIDYRLMKRYHLHFYSWTVRYFDAVFMRRARGKIFFMLRASGAETKPTRVTLMMQCTSAVPLTIRLNGQEAGIHPCPVAAGQLELDAPIGLIKPDVYSEIEIARPAETWREKASLWLGLRDKEVRLMGFRVDMQGVPTPIHKHD